MENLSLVFGMRTLLLIAIAVYAGAGIGLWRQQVTGVGTEVISHSVHP